MSSIATPKKFTFPFSYIPHELSVIATQELQEKINQENGWNHNYGFEGQTEGKRIGKMFGVLVVRYHGEIGYLAAFSGKLADKNIYDYFVPPIFDRLVEGSFYKKGEEELIGINIKVRALENAPDFAEARELQRKMNLVLTSDIEEYRRVIKASKKQRQKLREELGDKITKEVTEELKNQSSLERQVFKRLKKRVEVDLQEQADAVAVFENEIKELKQLRRKKSGALQQRLFDQYQFLNAHGETKDVCQIFKEVDIAPPAGAGDCAAPKLLQYAFEHELEPMALAEFWWGGASDKEVRKHGEFYPSCRGKCEPILGHMLKGLDVDENPIKLRKTEDLEIETVYEDDHIVVISKPPGLLSAPGKQEKDSVQNRMKAKYPEATGPLIAHRLDMATSGLMLVAKEEEVYKALQKQFLTGEIKKRYAAILDGELEKDSGTIELPLRVDFDNRPHQMVCYDYGKSAKTEWKVIDRKAGRTKVHFFPITGRTHQLRVHAAHPKGLNAAILGDVLYGTPLDRLYLHAEWISFVHPVTHELTEIELNTEFSL